MVLGHSVLWQLGGHLLSIHSFAVALSAFLNTWQLDWLTNFIFRFQIQHKKNKHKSDIEAHLPPHFIWGVSSSRISYPILVFPSKGLVWFFYDTIQELTFKVEKSKLKVLNSHEKLRLTRFFNDLTSRQTTVGCSD